MKRSIATVACGARTGTGAEAKVLSRMGTAFFTTGTGEFVTAYHVLREMQEGKSPCPIPVIAIPAGHWRPEARTEPLVLDRFKISECAVDQNYDLAVCRAEDDLSKPKSGLTIAIAPVSVDWNIPPDGMSVAFTGFPLGSRDPLTVRAGVAGSGAHWETEKPVPELVLDRAAWPGSSGSPVYLADGRIVAVIIGGGLNDANGLTIARPISLIRQLLEEKRK